MPLCIVPLMPDTVRAVDALPALPVALAVLDACVHVSMMNGVAQPVPAATQPSVKTI
jgi:hypothetical protein